MLVPPTIFWSKKIQRALVGMFFLCAFPLLTNAASEGSLYGAFVCSYLGGLLRPFGLCEVEVVVPVVTPPTKVRTVTPDPKPVVETAVVATSAISRRETPAESHTYITNTYVTKPIEVVREIVTRIESDSSREPGVSRALLNGQVNKIFDTVTERISDATVDLADQLSTIADSFSTDELTVQGTTELSGVLSVSASSTFAGQISLGGTNANIALGSNYLSGDGDDEGIFVSAAGRIGIGTTTPSELVSIVGGALYLDNFTPTTTTNRLYVQGGALYWAGNLLAGAAVGNWDGSGGDVYRLTGNVGIGTSTPGYNLSVVGSARITNLATFDSGINVNSETITDFTGNGLTLSGGALTVSTSSLTGLATTSISGTFSIAQGGTGAITASGARTNLGLAIGTDVQAYNANTSLLGSSIDLGTSEVTGTLAAANGGLGRSGYGGTNTILYTSAANTLATSSNFTYDGLMMTITGAGHSSTSSSVLVVNPVGIAIGSSSAVAFNNGRALVGYDGVRSAAFLAGVAGKYLVLDTDYKERLRITPTGEVGIGTTTPGYLFSLGGASGFTGQMNLSGSDANIALGSNFLSGDGGDEGVFVDASGNVAIGTTTSGRIFSVHSQSEAVVRYSSGGASTSRAVLQFENSSSSVSAWDIGINVSQIGDDNFTLRRLGAASSSTYVLTALKSGNVGIGTTTPGYLLSVGGTARITGASIFDSALSLAGSAANISLGSNYLSGDGGDEGVYVTAAGNVGIGTSTPAYKLSVFGDAVFGSTGNYVSVGNALNAGDTGLQLYYDIGMDAGVIQSADQGTAFKNTLINPYAGNVGIGTTTPGYVFSVAGTSGFTGQLNLTGSTANIALGSNYISGDGGDEGVYVTAAGNVGIGTTTPGKSLSIYGDVGLGGTSASTRNIARDGINNGVLALYGGDVTGANIELYGGTHATLANQAFLDADSFTFRSAAAASTTFVITSGTGVAVTGLGSFSAGINVNGETVTDLTGSGITLASGALTVTGLGGVASTSFLRSDVSDSYTSGTLTFDAATSLDLNTTGLSIADTDVSFDGASTNFNMTGNFSVNTSDFFISKSSGNVSIGTTSSPIAELNIAGDQTETSTTFEALTTFSVTTGSFAQFYRDYNGSQNYFGLEAFNVSSSSVKAPIVLQEFGGNVGIGSTTPGYKLSVAGTAAIAGDLTLFGTADMSVPDARSYGWGDDSTRIEGSSASDYIAFQTNGGIERMRVASGGNVGIGTGAPQSNLEVVGSMLINTDGTGVSMGSRLNSFSYGYSTLVIGSSASTSYYNGIALGGYRLNTTQPLGRFTFNSWNTDDTLANTRSAEISSYPEDSSTTNLGADLRFYTRTGVAALTERMRVTASGTVGIGTTTPAYALSVAGVGDNRITIDTSGTFAGYNITKSGAFKGGIFYNDTFGNISIQNALTNGINITSASNVGIGTSTPLSKLEVVTSNDTTGQPGVFAGQHFTVGNGNAGSVYMSYDQTNSRGFLGAVSPGVAWRNLVLNAGGGNVGIGSTTPGYKLSVAGTAGITGDLTLFGTADMSVPDARSYGWGDKSTRIEGNSSTDYIAFLTSGGGERMRVIANGNFGVGNSVPLSKFSVTGVSTTSLAAGSGANAIVEFTTGTGALTDNKIMIGFDDTNNAGWIQSVDPGTAYRVLNLNPQGGNVGIGTTTPSAQLTTTGTVRFSNFGAGTLQTDASGNLSVSSDERLKDVQGAYEAGLEAVLGLEPILYKWNKASGLEMASVYAGFSAQNVQAFLPAAVGEDPHGYLTLSDRPILAAVVNALKEVWTKVTEIGSDVDALKAENEVLKQRLDALEAAAQIPSGGEESETPSGNSNTTTSGDESVDMNDENTATSTDEGVVTEDVPPSDGILIEIIPDGSTPPVPAVEPEAETVVP